MPLGRLFSFILPNASAIVQAKPGEFIYRAARIRFIFGRSGVAVKGNETKATDRGGRQLPGESALFLREKMTQSVICICLTGWVGNQKAGGRAPPRLAACWA